MQTEPQAPRRMTDDEGRDMGESMRRLFGKPEAKPNDELSEEERQQGYSWPVKIEIPRNV